MTYFTDAKTIEDVKALYKELMKQHHPDKGGDVEVAKVINAEYTQALAQCMKSAFNKYKDDYHNQYKADYKGDINEFMFADILKKVFDFNCDIEVIGFWIYAFNSFDYKEQLKDLGFWFSKKHKAWVFSGSQKRRFATKAKLADIKEEKGSQIIRTHVNHPQLQYA